MVRFQTLTVSLLALGAPLVTASADQSTLRKSRRRHNRQSLRAILGIEERTHEHAVEKIRHERKAALRKSHKSGVAKVLKQAL
jgi:hypothetical protein